LHLFGQSQYGTQAIKAQAEIAARLVRWTFMNQGVDDQALV